MPSPSPPPVARHEVHGCTIVVEGLVQGVGFRPFVYRLATRHGLRGAVRNGPPGVLIDVEGAPEALRRFLADFTVEIPATGQPERLTTVPWSGARYAGAGFTIEPSLTDGPSALIPAPDLAPCPACLAELDDPAARRHRHPFLNCTACGPRFTIIRALPYDRERTTMAVFGMCAACRAEYEAPGDRRFHAEPIACPACGPRLTVLDAAGRPLAVAEPLAHAAAALRQGGLVAIKGLGGYHLACDATDAAAVAELRRRKRRDAKPFAVMVENLEHHRALRRRRPDFPFR
jgi:hydrogenase maturation protein HypF